MNTVTGRYQDGKVILDASVNWTNGMSVYVSLTTEKVGMTEAEWPTTAEGIQELIQKMRSFEPVELTPEEEAQWMAARQAVKQYSIKKMEEQEDLFE